MQVLAFRCLPLPLLLPRLIDTVTSDSMHTIRLKSFHGVLDYFGDASLNRYGGVGVKPTNYLQAGQTRRECDDALKRIVSNVFGAFATHLTMINIHPKMVDLHTADPQYLFLSGLLAVDNSNCRSETDWPDVALQFFAPVLPRFSEKIVSRPTRSFL